mmetsp:Transcript_41038/g.76324  ORF Transcript_41038/g.76324 Transcript_41038/m.76324 type:complete len:271 (+) Transcript_41038:73-885(+)
MRERTRSSRRSIRKRRCSDSRRRTPGRASRPRRKRDRSRAGRLATARGKSRGRVGARRSLEALFHWRRALESSWELDSSTTAPASGDESVAEATTQGPDNVAPATRWQVYCDLDGVLADFDRGVVERTGNQPKEFSRRRKMWRRLAPPRTKEFFARLDWMHGGAELWKYLEPLSPAILTGSPSGDWAGPQKVRWCEKNLKLPADRVLVVDASDKALFSHPGAILVDDRAEYRIEWEARGGIFVHFTEAEESIAMVRKALQQLGGGCGTTS